MTTWACPACGRGYLRRAGRCCPCCGVTLLLPGEVSADLGRAYVWTSTGWAEALSGRPAMTRTGGGRA